MVKRQIPFAIRGKIIRFFKHIGIDSEGIEDNQYFKELISSYTGGRQIFNKKMWWHSGVTKDE